jgi:hypothetical protein
MKEVGKFLRETIGDIPAFLIGLICGIWALNRIYRHWKSGNELDFEDYIFIFAGLFASTICGFEIFFRLI